jgi:uridine kinase
MSRMRLDLLRRVAERIPHPAGEDCVRVGVDGVDASGKTVFAEELADVLRGDGRNVVRVSVDDFHNPTAIRYGRGRSSPEGFWLDAFDYERLTAYVLDPLGPGGSRHYRPAAHDLARDVAIDSAYRTAPAGAVLVIDGLFLHRDELAAVWDFSIFLDVPPEVAVRRMAARDGTNPDPADATARRYVDAQRLYFAACTPQQRASVVIDNARLDAPHLAARRTPSLSAD